VNLPSGNHDDLASNQGLGARALLAERYDVLDAAGRLVRSVSREVAAEILDAGIANGVGRTCVKYLLLRIEVAERSRTSLRTWLGSANRGRVRPSAYGHDKQACATYRVTVQKAVAR